jgi:hypothetical protein
MVLMPSMGRASLRLRHDRVDIVDSLLRIAAGNHLVNVREPDGGMWLRNILGQAEPEVT